MNLKKKHHKLSIKYNAYVTIKTVHQEHREHETKELGSIEI